MIDSNVARIRLLARILAALAGLVAALAPIGYVTRRIDLVQLRPDLQGMSPLTALGLIGISAAVLANRQRATLRTAGASLAGAVGALTLALHVIGGSDTVSPLIGSSLFGADPATVGRTSVATGLGLTLLAFSALRRRAWAFAADVASGLALAIAGTALLGYLYGVSDLYALPVFNTLALNTAIAIVLLAAAELLIEPDLGWLGVVATAGVGGRATRRQLSFTLFPILAGWLLLRATNAAAIGPGAAMAMLVAATVVPLAVLILRDGRALNDVEHARNEKEEVQARLTADMADRLTRQAEQLAQEAAERARAESAMHRAQRMEAVGQLTGGIAHDFNNLLMAIRGNLELVQRRVSDGDERLQRNVSNAMAATDKGAKVTAQLLAFSRSQKLQVRPVEIDPVLAGARTLIGNALGPDIQVLVELDTSGAWATTDPDQLELAILNLAVNARDAMPDGGTLRIESGSCRARLSAEADETPYVSVRVIDNGAGMADDVAARAVEPFFTTKERDKGTGLGLAQVYGFVRQCGGDLRIVTAPGAGTSVEILLPCAEPVEAATSSERQDDPIGRMIGDGKQVLVIDDDDAVRAVIVEALSAAGFEVLEADGGESGLAILSRSQPAAVVIDFLMPGMNGAEVARAAQQSRPGLPIIFVSGYSDTVALDGISGAVVLRKPFDMSALDRALTSVLH